MASADAPRLGDLISAFATTPWPPQQIPKKTVHAIIHDNVIPDLVKGRDRLRFLLRFELKGCRRSQRTGTSHVELAPDALPFQRQASRTATVTDQPSTIGEYPCHSFPVSNLCHAALAQWEHPASVLIVAKLAPPRRGA
jgi:hypothetical protein